MKLITSLDDERLSLHILDFDDKQLFRKSLRAALEELTIFRRYRDEEKIVTFCNDCGPNVSIDEDGLCAGCGATAIGSHIEYISAVVAERDAALAQLCGAREILEIVAHLGVRFCEGGHDNSCDCIGRKAVAALSSSSPCPHYTAVKWAINAPEGWCGISKIFQDELRRLAGMEKK